jgi:hypothetical protein
MFGYTCQKCGKSGMSDGARIWHQCDPKQSEITALNGQINELNSRAAKRIAALEAEVADLRAELLKQIAGSKVVFDREVVERAKKVHSS